jgi:hypothetical protein
MEVRLVFPGQDDSDAPASKPMPAETVRIPAYFAPAGLSPIIRQ